jgi:hypothetical protein
MLAEIVWNQDLVETIMIFAIPIIGVIGVFSWLTLSTLSQNALKRDMVQQGMSADEINQILHSKRK